MDETWTSAVSARFDGDASAVREARRFVVEAVADVDPERADEAALLTSELATNAVIHARSAFTVTVRHTADGDGAETRIRVEVTDGSPAAARRCHYSATSGTGRGLGIVEDVASTWGVDDRPEGTGKVVWFVLTADRSQGEGADTASRGRHLTAVPGDASTVGEPPDLDALLADLGGWDDEPSGEASIAGQAA